MRRAEIAEGARQIERAITETELFELVALSARRAANEKNSNDENASLMAGLQFWSQAHQKFNQSALALLPVFGLEGLHLVSNWANLVFPDSITSSRLFSLQSNLGFAREFLPKIVSIYDNGQWDKESPDEEQAASATTAFSIVLIEGENLPATVPRLNLALESIEKFYRVCAALHEKPNDGLRITAADSGSDLAFLFTGDPTVIGCVLGILALIYKILLLPQARAAAQIENVADRLETLIEINEQEEQGKITHEEAGVLRLELKVATKNYIGAHAYCPKTQIRGYPTPRQISSPEQKQLTAPEAELTEEEIAEANIVSENEPEATGSAGLTSEESQLFELLKKKQQAGNLTDNHAEENVTRSK